MSAFLILASSGKTLALLHFFEEALAFMRRNDDAERVVRIADGHVLATKTRFGKGRTVIRGVLS